MLSIPNASEPPPPEIDATPIAGTAPHFEPFTGATAPTVDRPADDRPAVDQPTVDQRSGTAPPPETSPAGPITRTAHEHPEPLGATEIAEQLKRVSVALASLGEATSAFDEANRRLSARVEALSGDQVRALLKPVVERLATLHTTALAGVDDHRAAAPDAASDFAYFADAIEELLALYDLDSVGAKPGAPFDARVHHAESLSVTDDPALDGTIQRVLRQGFGFTGADRVMLPARVSVHRYRPPAV